MARKQRGSARERGGELVMLLVRYYDRSRNAFRLTPHAPHARGIPRGNRGGPGCIRAWAGPVLRLLKPSRCRRSGIVAARVRRETHLRISRCEALLQPLSLSNGRFSGRERRLSMSAICAPNRKRSFHRADRCDQVASDRIWPAGVCKGRGRGRGGWGECERSALPPSLRFGAQLMSALCDT